MLDLFKGMIIGNISSEPFLAEDEEGKKVCFACIATNSRAKKISKLTGKEIPKYIRTGTRSIVELRITNTKKADQFHEFIAFRDKILVKGKLETIKIPKLYWSEKEQDKVSVIVDIDENGKHLRRVMENKLIMWVSNFYKIEDPEDFIKEQFGLDEEDYVYFRRSKK